MKHIFNKPFTFEGQEYKELDLNLEGLIGDDLISVERELTATGTVVVTIQTSQAACLLIASRAAKVPSELIRALPLNEASKLAMSVQGFLLG